MNAPRFRRICAQRGSPFGSKPAPWVPRSRLSRRNKASRRTGTYLYSSARASAPRAVRAPQLTVPYTGNVLMQFRASGLRVPFSELVRFTASPVAPITFADVPAGAFQTPRPASVRAYRPAIAPAAGKPAIGLV